MKISLFTISIVLLLASSTAVKADITSLHGKLAWPESNTASPTDVEFILDNSRNTMTELELSQLAARKATEQSVKDFAAQTAEEDNLAQSSLNQIGETKGVIVPQQLDLKEQGKVNQLLNLPRSQFNTGYILRLIDRQSEDLLALENTPENLAPDLKAWAEHRLSTVRKQFSIANSFDNKDLRLGLLGG